MEGTSLSWQLPIHTAEWLVIDGPLNRELFHQAIELTLKEAKALHWRALEKVAKFTV